MKILKTVYLVIVHNLKTGRKVAFEYDEEYKTQAIAFATRFAKTVQALGVKDVIHVEVRELAKVVKGGAK